MLDNIQFRTILSSDLLTKKNVKIKIYKTTNFPVVLCGCPMQTPTVLKYLHVTWESARVPDYVASILELRVAKVYVIVTKLCNTFC
jgi:hypothetical protein